MAEVKTYSQLHDTMKASVPGDDIDPEHYRVAVINRLANEQVDPLWFICTPNGKLEKIRKRYLTTTVPLSVKYEEVFLVLDGRPITDHEARVQDHDTFGEKLIILEAFALSEMPESMRSCIATKKIKAEPTDPSSQCSALTSMTQHLSVEEAQAPTRVDHVANAMQQDSIPPSQKYSAAEVVNPKLPPDAKSLAATIQRLQVSVRYSTLESKESAVGQCIKLLGSLNEILSAQEDEPSLRVWEDRVAKLQKSFQKPKTTIGLLGQTGAGKSSLVNALLDEERIVPTSCMQACTAAPIQIAFNDVSASPYRAEIEFVQPSEWENELRIFLEDMKNISEGSPQKKTSGTASTLAKVHAVHPFLRGVKVCDDDISEAMDDVKEILGKIEVFESHTSDDFKEALQKFVFTKQDPTETEEDGEDEREDEEIESEDSKENEDHDGEKSIKADSAEAVEELWPLVKIVRIYTKSETLATGAVLMDLPGSNDSNAARSNIARGFMGQCDSLWIFSAIKRAVSDKTAKKILGASLNAQLVMDGSVDITTFVCTGTDDIRVTELSTSSTMKQLNQELNTHEKNFRSLKTAIKTLERNVDTAMAAEDKYDNKIADLEGRVRDMRNPYVTPPKRMASPDGESSAKKRKTSTNSFIMLDDDDDDDDEDDFDFPMTDGMDSSKGVKSSGSLQSLERKIEQLQALKREKHDLVKTKRDLLRQKRIERESLQETIMNCRELLTSKCIKERSKFCKEKIRDDYVDWIRDFDEREAQRKDPEHFDPSLEIRDYNLLRNNLPVFCTSSIAYQKMSGRYINDRDIIGFQSKDDTEIPAVKAYCVQLTVPKRHTACEGFLLGFCDLVSSIMLWASNCETLERIVSKESIQREKLVMRSLDSLCKDLKKAVIEAMDSLRSKLDAHIYKKFPTAVNEAVKNAAETSKDWEAARWNTYKATCVRSGVFRDKDWNQALLDPIMQKIAHDWNMTFTTATPRVLKDFTTDVDLAMEKFHRNVEKALNHAPLQTGEDLLLIQGSNFRLALENLCSSTTTALNSSQKDISRSFTSLIQNGMSAGYQACSAEFGIGSYKRMKDGMSKHVSKVQQSMFAESCDDVMSQLRQMIDDTEKTMLAQVEARWKTLRNDYWEAVGNFNNKKDMPLRKRRRGVARRMMSVLCDCDQINLKLATEESMQ